MTKPAERLAWPLRLIGWADEGKERMEPQGDTLARMQADAKPRRVMLVYQAGIANVFQVESFNLSDYGRDAVRVFQGDFYGAANVARGMGLAGCIVRSAGCNQAGDITHAHWSDDFGPFRSEAQNVMFG